MAGNRNCSKHLNAFSTEISEIKLLQHCSLFLAQTKDLEKMYSVLFIRFMYTGHEKSAYSHALFFKTAQLALCWLNSPVTIENGIPADILISTSDKVPLKSM